MNKTEESKIRKLVLEKIKSGVFSGSSYWTWFKWVKSLNLGHRPTKEETDEVLFFGLSVRKNPENWEEGAKDLLKLALKVC